MNRQRFIERDFQGEGLNEQSRALALAFAELADPQFLEAVLHFKAALDEFGGQVFIAASRDRFNARGELDREQGRFVTYGYTVHYGSKATIKRLQTEEEAGELEAPAEPEAEEPQNGAEPVGAVEQS